MDSLQITAYNIYDEDGTYKGTVYSEAEMESTLEQFPLWTYTMHKGKPQNIDPIIIRNGKEREVFFIENGALTRWEKHTRIAKVLRFEAWEVTEQWLSSHGNYPYHIPRSVTKHLCHETDTP